MTRLLTFDTLLDRPTIAIDGTEYDLARPEDFGLVALAKIERMQRRLNGLMGRIDELTEDEILQVVEILDGLVALVLPELPAARLAKLRDNQKLAIVQAFQQATETPAAGPPSQNQTNPPTSAP